jgi:iron(III) transport system ATP-binding protein
VEAKPAVVARNLSKRFRRADGTVVQALDDVSLEVGSSEFLVLLGPSGCGKSTLLRCIVGLERLDEGEIRIAGKLTDAPTLRLQPEQRGVSMVFQSYALWPHMTAFENVAFPLRAQGWHRSLIDERVHNVLGLVGIANLGRQYPGQMSGGQQQRVALARAIAPESPLILFDEPLSNVDAKVRMQVRLELLTMQRELGFAAVYVTHDQIEAMELADRIAVMDAGRIVQLDVPRAIYQRPQSRYVADFIGTSNELPGSVLASGDGKVRVGTALGEMQATVNDRNVRPGEAAVLVFRPERCGLSMAEPDTVNRWRGVVKASLFVGSHTEHLVETDGVSFRLWRADDVIVPPGSAVWISVEARDVLALPERD